MAITFELRTFLDIVDAIREEVGIQSGDTTAVNRIKRDVNAIYMDVVAREQWKWLRGNVSLTHPAFVNAGTAAVSASSADVTLTIAPGNSRKESFFKVDGYAEIYRIDQHTAASTTLTLETPFTGTTSTAVGYKIWSDRIALPSDCRETFEVMHNHTNTPMEGIGLQEFRRQQASSPTTEGRPRYYSTGDFHDPDPYAAISGLPAVSTMASAGLVKTIVFASDASSFLKVSDRIEVSGASHFSFNGQVIVSSVSTTAVTYTGTVDYKQVATADTPTIEKLSIEANTERYRELLVHPALFDTRVTIYVDYIKQVLALTDDADEPLIPLEYRNTLLYGGLFKTWQKKRNPDAAKDNFALYEKLITAMSGKLDDSTDFPRLQLNKSYLGRKRSFLGRQHRGGFLFGSGAGSTGGQNTFTGTPASTAIFDGNGELVGSSAVSTTELNQLDGILSKAVGVSDTQTLTNKTIDADDNPISNLAHGAEVDNASSGVHGAVGTIVGTTDTQTLTNKSIDSANNTITNIVNVDIKSDAAIARTKIANGTASHVVTNDGSGTLSSEASLAETRGGTAQTTYVAGDIIYASAADTLTRLAKGTDGNILKQAAGIPSWASASLSLTVVTKTTTYTLLSTDDLVLSDASGGAFTLTLPAAASNSGKVYYIKKIDAGLTDAVTVDGNASETIDGATTTTLNTENEQLTIVSDGTNWEILEHRIPSIVTSYTPTGSWTTNTTYTGNWYRDGVFMIARIRVATSGAPDTASLTVDIPSGPTIDTNFLLQNDATEKIGFATVTDGGGSTTFAEVHFSDTNSVQLFYGVDSGVGAIRTAVNQASPITFGSTDYVIAEFKVEIVGWKG